MKHFEILFIGCISLVGSFCNAFSQVNSGTNIISNDGISNSVIQDLKQTLSAYNAGTINIQKVPLNGKTGQAFFLSSKNNMTQIQYTTQHSLENAIYTYLDCLGFRWYGPGENWFIKPKKLNLTTIPGKWYQPIFRNRSFFGTGGLNFGYVQAYDPNNEYMKKWYVWKRRNRFNADFEGVGHMGQNFYLENKTLLDRNPQWFLNEQGRKNGRIKIEEPQAVQAFKSWVKNRFKKGNSPFLIVGVDPEDGRGGTDDPLPPPGFKGIKNWNHADKWWWLANEVAKEFDESDNRIVVSMYAYGDGVTNALVPSFRLRKNVYPVIVPYAFQRAYLPDEMVRVWAEKVNGNMGMYDYWNITQWSLGMPQFNIFTIKDRLSFWHNHKIDGVYLESTDAAGPMGHALWLMGQLQWSINKNFDDLYAQYLNECFGGAAPHIRNMFDRWSKNYQDAGEPVFSLQDLKRASDAVQKSSNEWKRITELKAYVHFMKMYYEHDGTQKNKDAIFRYLYSIHHLMMVQTAAFVGQQYIPPFDRGNIVPDGKGIHNLSLEEIEENFRMDLKKTKESYKLSQFLFDETKVQYLKTIPAESWRFGGFKCLFYFKAPFTGEISMDAGAESNTQFRVYSHNKSLIDERVGQENFNYIEELTGHKWFLKRYKLKILKDETYFIETSDGFSRVIINNPGIVLLKNAGNQDFDNYQYPLQYFYVPKDADKIVFYDKEREGINGRGYLIAPNGEKIKRQETGLKDIYIVPVAIRDRGRIWQADFGHPNWRLKNIPNIVSLQEFNYQE